MISLAKLMDEYVRFDGIVESAVEYFNPTWEHSGTFSERIVLTTAMERNFCVLFSFLFVPNCWLQLTRNKKMINEIADFEFL
jgi:hypothetical protein